MTTALYLYAKLLYVPLVYPNKSHPIPFIILVLPVPVPATISTRLYLSTISIISLYLSERNSSSAS